ncbi:MAG: FecR domain-containing protein, partial [Pseudomonadota bacterium]
MVLSLTEARSIAPDEVVLSAQDATSILIPSDTLLFSADFVRDGGDLVLINDDSAPIRIVGYFTQDDLPTLTVPNGAALQGHVIDVLAGPQAPFQFAQAGGGVTNPANAIGQVEEVTGDATVQRADGTTVPLQLGMKVFANDVVSTGSDSSLSLTFVDGTIFTLAASSRMVLDSLIYDPNATDNSGVFNLVEGTFVFIAGQVAKTGGFEVVTPAATMGIRGTTVVVEIRSENGQTVVEVSLDADPNGDTGEFTITGLDGTLIANVDSTDTKWVISPLDNVAEQVERTAEDLLEAEFLIQRSYSSFEQATTRVDNGGEFVEPTDSTPNQQPTDEQNNDNINTDSDTDQQFDEPPEGDEAPIDLQPEGSDGTGGDEASLGSGAQTDFTIDSPAATNTSETTSV